ncbi:MAG TPA: alpha-hydroxy acid oxidase [Steroidobacteraceae bacterium]|nr:alpha-hydroxy acid oxidase [Steroidobacteraceae bacterium]
MAASVADFRHLARRRLPRVVFDYVDGGAEGEVTLQENERAFRDVAFCPRYAAGVQECDLDVEVLGRRLSMPLLLAPCGFTRLIHPLGDLAAARAAGKAAVGFTLSTMSSYRLEAVARASSSGPLWYQLYLIGGRGTAEDAIERARVAGFSALVVTIDTPVAGRRERDIRNGAAVLLGGDRLAMLPFLPQLVARPRWLMAYLRDGGPTTFPNIVLATKRPLSLKDAHAALRQCTVTWSDLSWIRRSWPGPIVIKGILTADDARRALDAGAEGIVVSNHGGRQLDCVPASLRVLPEIVAAVHGRAFVLMDGGIRRGSDILKAICLGARAVLVGRAYLYGLAAAGENGITTVLEILRADMSRSMALLGCSSISELNPSLLRNAIAISLGD